MTHNEKRTSPLREAGLSLFTGGLYGATHTISGHPLDTIKSSKSTAASSHLLHPLANLFIRVPLITNLPLAPPAEMQISGGEYKNASAFRTASLIMSKEGPIGFFRGVGIHCRWYRI